MDISSVVTLTGSVRAPVMAMGGVVTNLGSNGLCTGGGCAGRRWRGAGALPGDGSVACAACSVMGDNKLHKTTEAAIPAALIRIAFSRQVSGSGKPRFNIEPNRKNSGIGMSRG
jgi:hypothetical protein